MHRMKIIKAEKLVHEYIHRDEDNQVESIQTALDGVDIEIEKGQFVAILGHNGSGKSTLAKHMNAILEPSGGEMWVDGMDTSDEKHLWDIRQSAGMVFQNPDNQLVTTVVEEVAEEFGANTAVALSRAKAYVAENAEESDEVDARELGREVFADQPRVAERFEAAVEKGALPERVVVEKAVAKRVTKSHKIRTDTGIELTFPAEYGENSDFIEFFSTPDGRIEIALKNIGAIENR